MITLALIGIGKWGQNYLRTAATLKNVQIKYVCAQTQQTLNLLPHAYIKTLSVNDLLKYKDIEGFILATPASTHFVIAKKLLSLGNNLLVEKPFTTNYRQAFELRKIWQNKKPQVLIGHTYIYDPAYQSFKKALEDTKTINSMHFEGLSSHIRNDISVIWDWGPHPVSIFLDLIKQPVVEVTATGSIADPNNKLYDTTNALIRFANGIEASISISWLGSHKVRRLTIKRKNKKRELDYTKTTGSALTEELVEFTQAIQGIKKITSNIDCGVSVVKILSAIEKSVKNNGRLIKLT
ncbi:MAG: Gfo/Idh/MocA family oxidoreductase [Candidatus Daviesbacteria bacterium]|nr:Gfo/Idh/MocA family oxidoreductase [Candidatus Daviesbacteria bacterium]